MPGLPALSNPVDDGRDTSAHEIESERRDAREAVQRSPSPRRRPAHETFSLGRYVITGRIASGGMATVYRARLESQGGFAREFAIKVIHPHLAAAEGFKDRFLDEARVASRVNHPHVVATVDSDQDRGYHYLVLELVDGVTLRQLQVVDLQRSTTDEDRRLTPAEAARVVCDAARGLHAVHSVVDDQGEALEVVHRDLSPHNLMLDVTGRTVLIDLGLAKARGQLGHTQTGVLCGKLPYMSPEQSQLQPLDARSDVFSLGSVLFELAVGVAPFGDDHTPGTLENLRKCDPARLGDMLASARVPSWLSQVILACLRADPAERYGSAEGLAEALDEGMRRAGVVQSEVRQSLSRRAQALTARVGKVLPAEPLPPLIAADPTGPHRALGLSTIPSWARGLGLAIAGALLVLIALTAVNALRRGAADPPDTTPSATSNGQVPTADSTPAPERADAHEADPQPAGDAATTATSVGESAPGTSPNEADGADAVDTDLDAPRKTRRGGTRKQDPLAEFKGNPYD